MAKGSLFDNRKTKRSPQDADYGGDISISRDEVKYLYDQLKQFPDNPYPKLRIYGETGVKKDGGEYIKPPRVQRSFAEPSRAIPIPSLPKPMYLS